MRNLKLVALAGIASFTVASLAVSQNAYAGCVISAKSKTSFTVLDSHTIVLTGGVGNNILIRTFSFIYSSSTVTVLKDDFCDFDSAVLYIDGEVADVQRVETLD